MTLYGNHVNLNLADDPADSAWRWFILNGPHGERFKWVQYKQLPKDIEYLNKLIEEYAENIPDFKNKIRQIALVTLRRKNEILIRTAIQVLTIVGTDDDMNLIQPFISSENKDIQNDAKCALFERGIKTKRKI